jgi:hypothetical protein
MDGLEAPVGELRRRAMLFCANALFSKSLNPCHQLFTAA